MISLVVATLCMYMLGSVSGSLLLSRLRGWADPRTRGSGNAGATNMLRIHGRWAGAVVFLLDSGKALFALWLGNQLLSPDNALESWCLNWIWLFAVVLGHVFPLFHAFRGGKGMAPFIGGVFYLQPWITLLILILVLPILAWSRRSSVSSLLALLIYLPLGLASVPVYALHCQFLGAAATSLLIIWAHRSNLQRLLEGREPGLK